jgi:hypothetical protein
MGFLRKLFGGGARPADAGVRDDERLEDLYEEFCRTFQHRPGENFMECLRATDTAKMIEWLRPETPCAIPKGFIRLAVDATRKGYRLWEQPGLSMYYEGNWTAGGGLPPQESQEGLSVLARLLKLPIKLYYTETQGGDTMVTEYTP